MADKLRIASKSPMPLRMEVVNDDGSISSVVINPAGAEAGFPEGVTENVDADLYRRWIDENSDHAFVVAGLLRELAEDEIVTEYGFEAGLAKAAEDEENVKLSEQGSTITDPAPVGAQDMAATSETPNDDSPRSDVNTGLESNPAPAAVSAAEETTGTADQSTTDESASEGK